MSGERILIVDDSQENLELLAVLAERNGWAYDTADSGVAALEKLGGEHYDLVITDLMMPAMNGIELLSRIKENWPETEVIIVTAHGSIPTAIDAIKKGAYTYLLRPFEPEEVTLTVNKIFELQSIKNENRHLREELSRMLKYDTIVGRSRAMRKVYEMIDAVAQTNSTILITGESGSGKELIARALHNKSGRANRPFVKVSCAALPEPLLESELFGHEKGAFTGAIATRKGRFELADGGTLFLDEIGEIPPSVQVKLLRAIQEREFERVGGTRTIKTDARMISATNRDLAEEVKRGAFREDLYYRLNVISIEAPPMRDRKEDIPLLAYHFLEMYGEQAGKKITSISDRALAAFKAYDWPGNVRELQNVIERAMALAGGDVIDVADLPESFRGTEGPADIQPIPLREELGSFRAAKSAWEKSFIERALSIFHGNISRTAAAIDLARKNLQEKIKIYNIDVSKYTGKKA
ncbi:MAG: sigma-54-dependent transcriptional regulator [Candidatus Nitrospinota bacterium M3_3B_026]